MYPHSLRGWLSMDVGPGVDTAAGTPLTGGATPGSEMKNIRSTSVAYQYHKVFLWGLYLHTLLIQCAIFGDYKNTIKGPAG